MIFSAFVIGVIVIVVVYILIYSVRQVRKYGSFNKLPGPSIEELIKIFVTKSRYDKYHYLVNLTRRYGPVLKLWLKPFSPVVIVADVEIMKRILLSKNHLCKTKTYDMTSPVVGEGLGTTSKVDLWKRDRKICSLAFQPSNTTAFLSLISKYTNKFLEIIKDHTDKVVDIQPLIHLYALDIAFEFATKHERNFQDEMSAAYLSARIDFLKVLSERMYSVFLQNETLFRFSKYFKSMNKAARIMKKCTYDVIISEYARTKGANNENYKHMHMIDVLFANNIDLNHVHDQIDTFIIAAHDTTAETTCFVLYELSRHPKAQQKLFEEISSFMGDQNDVTCDMLQQMIYLEAVVKETLRLHPALPMIERTLGSDVDIDGIHYPKSTKFVFSIVGIHTSPKYYENPDKFDPERFMPENDHKLDKYSFVPFSVGPRNCIGKLFAMLQLKYSVARIMQRYELFPDENHVLKVVGELVAKSMTGIPVILKERCN